jgi:DNA-binding Lrp family transcriptional regulator
LLKSIRIREADLALVEALQIAPRASWTAVGEALGITAVTAARRWERLTQAGLAWVTAAPGMPARDALCLAYIEISCRSGVSIQVANALARDSHALTVELTTGSADILVTAAAGDLDTMSRYLLERLGRLDGITATRARIATRVYTEGSAWSLGRLDRAAVQHLARHRVGHGATDGSTALPVGEFDHRVRAMVMELNLNGRASYADLAAQLQLSPAGARRHVVPLLASGAILPRTDVASPLWGWPVQVYLWATAPIGALAETARELGRFRQTRLAVTLVAAPSLLIAAWFRTLPEIHQFELGLATKLRHLQVTDRLLVLRSVKRMGRLLDSCGRAVGVLPIDVWRDPLG